MRSRSLDLLQPKPAGGQALEHPLAAGQDEDLKLLGGRLLPGEAGPAALLMFENGSGDRITFYMSKIDHPQMAFRYYVSDHVAAIRWVVGDYGYVVSGPADKMRLKELARAAFEQLENRAPPPHPNRQSNEPVASRSGG